MNYSKNILKIDTAAETERIVGFIRGQVQALHRKGIVIGLSGGVDSAVSAALSVRAVGKERVLGLLLPDKESSPDSAAFAARQAEALGIETMLIDITPVLEAFGTYAKRDSVVRSVFPNYGTGYGMKITLPPDIINKEGLNFFTLTVIDPHGAQKSARLTNEQSWGIIAATCTKHRTRMMTQYYYSERQNHLVCGTTNRSEAVQGLFVKYGDGGVDIEPIAHLYKNQVFQLADYLSVIPEIIRRAPCPDTYSAPVTDEEWYFRIPFGLLDLLLYAWEHHIPLPEIGQVTGLSEDQIGRVFRDFTHKYQATRHLTQMPPALD